MLSIKGVSKHFGGLKALKNVSFDIADGRVHGIIGPNGSGKTTMFNCITGLLEVTSGNIYLDDVEITGKKAHEISNLGRITSYNVCYTKLLRYAKAVPTVPR